MEVNLQIYKLYEIFTKAFYALDRFSYNKTKTSEDTIEKFFCLFEKSGVRRQSLGLNFFYDYFCYTYNYYLTLDITRKTVPLNWIVGKKMVGRWNDKIDQYRLLYGSELLKQRSIPTLFQVKEMLEGPNEIEETPYHEEIERKRFINTPNGFLNCILSTTLCDERSKVCRVCDYKGDCKDELKQRNRTLYVKRFVNFKEGRGL